MVTGVSGPWGVRLTRALARRHGAEWIVAVDAETPAASLDGVEYHPLSLRSAGIVELLERRQIDTVVHLVLKGDEGGRERMFEANVMGTRFLVAACQAAGTRRIVARSSTLVYGAFPDNPNFLTEDRPVRARTRMPFIRDLVEQEGIYVEARRSPTGGPNVTVLRFAGIVGPTCHTATTRYLGAKGLVSVLGFDPLLQFVHEDDVADALVQACQSDVSGPINVAGDGVFPLSQVAAILGKVTVPTITPLVPTIARLARTLPGVAPPELPPDYLRYLWVVDTGRMRRDLGFEPRHTGRQALEAFARSLELARYRPREEPPLPPSFEERWLSQVLEADDSPAGA